MNNLIFNVYNNRKLHICLPTLHFYDFNLFNIIEKLLYIVINTKQSTLKLEIIFSRYFS